VIGVVVVALIVSGLAVLAGVSLGHEAPVATRWLLGFWSLGVIALAGAVAALIADRSTQVVAADDASDATKTIAALAAAALVAVGTQANSWLPNHLSPWLARKVIWSRYAESYFPCVPAEMPKGVEAWERLTDSYAGDLDEWTGPKVESLLKLIKDAVDHRQTAKDSGWRCA
jgi:hypothetical protein